MYLTLVLHGVGTLMPWNIFINAKTVSYVSQVYCYAVYNIHMATIILVIVISPYQFIGLKNISIKDTLSQYSKLQSLIQAQVLWSGGIC